MRVFLVTFDDGDSLATGFNGTEEEAQRYYVGHKFNLGDGSEGDRVVTATKVELITE